MSKSLDIFTFYHFPRHGLMTGSKVDMFSLSFLALLQDDMTMRVRVFARAKPADKLEIVKSLQRQGLVCAMHLGFGMSGKNKDFD